MNTGRLRTVEQAPDSSREQPVTANSARRTSPAIPLDQVGERRETVPRAPCGPANRDVVEIGALALAVLLTGVREGDDRGHRLSMTT